MTLLLKAEVGAGIKVWSVITGVVVVAQVAKSWQEQPNEPPLR